MSDVGKKQLTKRTTRKSSLSDRSYASHCKVVKSRSRQSECRGFESQSTQDIFSCEISAKMYLYNHLSFEFEAFHKCELHNASFVSCAYTTDVPENVFLREPPLKVSILSVFAFVCHSFWLCGRRVH